MLDRLRRKEAEGPRIHWLRPDRPDSVLVSRRLARSAKRLTVFRRNVIAEAAAIEIVPHVKVKEIGLAELGKTAGLLGRGMCDNPADLRLFRIGDRERRIRALARFFEPVLRSLYARGLILGAFRDSTLAGVCAMARPGFCQATAFEKLQLAPTVILGSPIGTTARVLKWSGEWQRRDPRGPHWHVGPVAVDPLFQHQGIGSTMLSVFCACMDGFSAVAYLETDKSENVRFYQKFGFTVVGQADVLGVPNWFMSRRPRFTTVNRALTSGKLVVRSQNSIGQQN